MNNPLITPEEVTEIVRALAEKLTEDAIESGVIKEQARASCINYLVAASMELCAPSTSRFDTLLSFRKVTGDSPLICLSTPTGNSDHFEELFLEAVVHPTRQLTHEEFKELYPPIDDAPAPTDDTLPAPRKKSKRRRSRRWHRRYF